MLPPIHNNKKDALRFHLASSASASPVTLILRMEPAFNTMFKALYLQRFPAYTTKIITTIKKLLLWH